MVPNLFLFLARCDSHLSQTRCGEILRDPCVVLLLLLFLQHCPLSSLGSTFAYCKSPLKKKRLIWIDLSEVTQQSHDYPSFTSASILTPHKIKASSKIITGHSSWRKQVTVWNERLISGTGLVEIRWLFLRVRSIKLQKSVNIFHLSSGRWYLATLVDLWGSQTKFPSPILRLVCHQVSPGSIHETLVRETQKFLKFSARVTNFWWTERLMMTRNQVMMTQKRL